MPEFRREDWLHLPPDPDPQVDLGYECPRVASVCKGDGTSRRYLTDLDRGGIAAGEYIEYSADDRVRLDEWS